MRRFIITLKSREHSDASSANALTDLFAAKGCQLPLFYLSGKGNAVIRFTIEAESRDAANLKAEEIARGTVEAGGWGVDEVQELWNN